MSQEFNSTLFSIPVQTLKFKFIYFSFCGDIKRLAVKNLCFLQYHRQYFRDLFDFYIGYQGGKKNMCPETFSHKKLVSNLTLCLIILLKFLGFINSNIFKVTNLQEGVLLPISIWNFQFYKEYKDFFFFHEILFVLSNDSCNWKKLNQESVLKIHSDEEKMSKNCFEMITFQF
jgi:hypothetical protein